MLADLARRHGVFDMTDEDTETVRREWHKGESRGVQGSPHFFCGDVDLFCPSLDIAKDEHGHLQVQRNIGLLSGFLADCLADAD